MVVRNDTFDTLILVTHNRHTSRYLAENSVPAEAPGGTEVQTDQTAGISKTEAVKPNFRLTSAGVFPLQRRAGQGIQYVLELAPTLRLCTARQSSCLRLDHAPALIALGIIRILNNLEEDTVFDSTSISAQQFVQTDQVFWLQRVHEKRTPGITTLQSYARYVAAEGHDVLNPMLDKLLSRSTTFQLLCLICCHRCIHHVKCHVVLYIALSILVSASGFVDHHASFPIT